MQLFILLLFLPIVLLQGLLGITFLIAAGSIWVKFRKRHKSKKWSFVSGEIIEHPITLSLSSEGVSVAQYTIAYTYAVNGIPYKSNFLKGLSSKNTPAEAEREAQRKYPIGQSVKVFYNPKKHQESILSPELELIDWNDRIVFLMTGFFGTLLIASFVLFFGLMYYPILVIGSPPPSDCYTPDYQQKKWVSSPCSDIAPSGGGR